MELPNNYHNQPQLFEALFEVIKLMVLSSLPMSLLGIGLWLGSSRSERTLPASSAAWVWMGFVTQMAGTGLAFLMVVLGVTVVLRPPFDNREGMAVLAVLAAVTILGSFATVAWSRLRGRVVSDLLPRVVPAETPQPVLQRV